MHRLTTTLALGAGLLGGASAPAFAQSAAPAPVVQNPPAVSPAAPGVPTAPAAPTTCTGTPDPYKNYACLDTYLSTGILQRFVNYYKLEWGQAGPPTDPNAPPGRKAGWDPAPQTTPPMPFTDWPYGGTTTLGGNRTGSVDSPLMVAIANTAPGQWLNDTGIQIYGWLDPGGNVSTNSGIERDTGQSRPSPTPHTQTRIQLDQVAGFMRRAHARHHTDGSRSTGAFGCPARMAENYRYTMSYGISTHQFTKYNNQVGYDFPMLYGELFIPQVAQGSMLRLGRYISIPDIEATARAQQLHVHALR